MKILLLLFLLRALAGLTIAQELRYAGNHHKLDETARESEAVCLAEFVNLGDYDVGPPLCTIYSNAVVKFTRALLPDNLKTVRCRYIVQTHPPDSREEAPILGMTYLMLGSKSGDLFTIRKMVEPTPENIAIVENVLRDRGIEITTDTQSQPARPEAPSQSVQTAEAKPTTNSPNDDPPPATPWSIIAALIVAALAVAWRILKRRS
jgi:hypothetical protein